MNSCTKVNRDGHFSFVHCNFSELATSDCVRERRRRRCMVRSQVRLQERWECKHCWAAKVGWTAQSDVHNVLSHNLCTIDTSNSLQLESTAAWCSTRCTFYWSCSHYVLSLLSWAIPVYSDVDQLANVHLITVEVSFAINHAVYFTRNILFWDLPRKHSWCGVLGASKNARIESDKVGCQNYKRYLKLITIIILGSSSSYRDCIYKSWCGSSPSILC